MLTYIIITPIIILIISIIVISIITLIRPMNYRLEISNIIILIIIYSIYILFNLNHIELLIYGFQFNSQFLLIFTLILAILPCIFTFF